MRQSNAPRKIVTAASSIDSYVRLCMCIDVSAFVGSGAVSRPQAYGLAGLGVGFIIFLSSLTVFASNGFKPTRDSLNKYVSDP
jgi:hypothetical protein